MKKNKQFTSLLAFIIFLAAALFLRLPYFFIDVIDWDESTFIVIGQSILDGHLPYTETWDLKPPLLPATFSLFILFFGKNIAAIRMGGAICVALTSWITYQIGRELRSIQHGLIAGFLTTASLSLIHSDASATMSEHIAIVPLMCGIWITINQKFSSKSVFISGLLLTASALIRLNLAYVVIAIGIAITAFPTFHCLRTKQYLKNALATGICFTCGGALILSLTLLPYALTNQSTLWWKSVVLAPLSYSNSRFTWSEALIVHIKNIIELITDWQPIPPSSASTTAVLLAAGTFSGIFILILKWKKYAADEKRGLAILCISFLGTSISILKSGQAHFHYLFQICPFLSFFAAEFYTPLTVRSRLPITLTIGAFISTLIFSTPCIAYKSNFDRIIQGEPLQTGPSFNIAKYLEKKNLAKNSVFMTKHHLTYWLIDQQPPTPSSTHPSNLAKDFLLQHSMYPGATPYLALKEVFDLHPRFVAAEQNISYFRKYPKALQLFKTTIQEQYKLDTTIDNINIYQRRQRN